MANCKITTRSVEALKRRATNVGNAHFLWDTELKGFGVRASGTTGHVSWVFQYRIGGRGGASKRISFASCPPTSAVVARKEAEKLKGDVRNGIDVIERKKARLKEQERAVQTKSLGVLIDLYVKEKHWQSERYHHDVQRIFASTVLPELGPKTRVNHIKKEDIRDLLKTKAHAPGVARNLFATLRPFFAWLAEEDYIQVSPMADLKAPKTIKARDRVLIDDEIKELWKATDRLNDLFSPFYKLLLLTGQRREEVGAMCWHEVNLEECTWTIPKTRAKNHKQHVVHLAPQAIAIIKVISRKEPSEFVFTTTGKTPISGYSKAKRRLDELMDVSQSWRVHDLRRTAASGMARLGFQPQIVERVLNHISGATGGLVGVYQRYEYLDERKRALHAWANLVDEIVSDANGKRGNVVRMGASVSPLEHSQVG